MEILKIDQICKQYQKEPLLENISFSVQLNETICLLGPSGGGKSTLLRIIAGLESPDQGYIFWRGENITQKEAHQRNFGLMFQDYALFPHMNVFENTAFGLRMQKISEQNIVERCMQALEMVHMDQFAERRVTDLSGGEQQRVALARTLAPRPCLLMLDEPMGALDRTLRARLSDELRSLLHQLDIPVIYVTHDQDEAFAFADRILILNNGHIIQSGKPDEVYANPASLWLASFFGMENMITGEVIKSDPVCVKTDIGIFQTIYTDQFIQGKRVTLVLKPAGAFFNEEKAQTNSITGIIEENIYQADRYKIHIKVDDVHQFYFFSSSAYPLNQEIKLKISPESILCYGET